jgi:hypothetical protein
MFQARDISLKAAAVGGLLLLLMPFLRLEGERVIFRLGPFQQAVPGACLFQSLTGLDCPFCGLSRGFVCAAHFRFREAWRYNWAAIPVLAFTFLYAAAGLFVLLGRRKKSIAAGWAPAAVVYSRATLAAVLLAGWLVRIIIQRG